jgi:hypothetical protein
MIKVMMIMNICQRCRPSSGSDRKVANVCRTECGGSSVRGGNC